MAARRSTGGVVIDTRRKSPVFALRFRAHGRRQYITLGSAEEGWSRERAEQALRHTLADVERGIWEPPDRTPAATPAVEPEEQDPTFLQFAFEWYHDNKGGWRERTRVDYQWQLSHHLLPYFGKLRLSEITPREIDRYTAAKVREGQLSAVSINKTLTRLGQVLKRAKRWGLIDRNPVEDAERLKATRPAPVWLDRAEHIEALLDAAGELDKAARRDRRHVPRRAMLATLVFAGLRIGEMLELRWRDVDVAGGTITVRASKTDAGVRQVDMLPALRDELLALKAATRDAQPNRLVFPTTTGERHGPSNIRRRVLAPAVELASAKLVEAGDVPLPDGLTPHKLRHTFASLLVALGVDPGAAMDQLGHTDPSFTLRVYRHGMRRDPASREALRRLVGLTDQPAIGQQVGSNAIFGVGHMAGMSSAPGRI